MSAVIKGVYIVGAKRTPFGSFGGTLKNINQTALQATAAKAALQSAGLRGDQVDTVVIGNVITSSSIDGIYLPRHVGLHCGVPVEKPALGINRLCGSGFQAIVNGAHDILLSNAKIALTGGVENMSQSPFIVRNMRFGTTLGTSYNFEDSLWNGLTDTYCNLPMALTAENLAQKYQISRDKVDAFALQSQLNWAKGQKEGAFKEEITPIHVKVKGKEMSFDVDEHPRPNTTMESLTKLKPVFKKDGVVTAGNASGICDGAASIVLASEDALAEYSLKPLARVVAYAYVGVPPEIMGIGPVTAIQNVLKVSGKEMRDIDLIEINEAFAAQALACAQELAIDKSKLNVNGGAVAIGHPLGASGSRITAHLVHEMKRRKVKYSIGSACIGGGQGIALLLENCI